MKYLIWLIIGLAVVVWLQRAKKNLIRRARDAASAQAGGAARGGQPAAEAKVIEQMVQCAQCGIHFPASEAVHANSGAVFCCAEHRELHALDGGMR